MAHSSDQDKSTASVFGAYSAYYDLLYRDKDYAGEASYVQSLVARHLPRAKTLLDLGCGTGRHAQLLSEAGYQVFGVDSSEDMLARARAQVAAAPTPPAGLPEFAQGDVRSVRLGRKFDAVTALFHVMSYQTTNADLKAAFETAKAHLEPGGVLLFDCWYGPAVLTLRPSVRIARFEDEHNAVTRLAEPVMHPNRNLVDVNYQVLIKSKSTGKLEELRETHTMRYLFQPEVSAHLDAAGLELEEAVEFMTDGPLGFSTWTAVFVARLRA